MIFLEASPLVKCSRTLLDSALVDANILKELAGKWYAFITVYFRHN